MSKNKKVGLINKWVNRLFAAQYLYEIELNGSSIEVILADFNATQRMELYSNLETNGSMLDLPVPDKKKVIEILNGVAENRGSIDKILSDTLIKDHALEKLDVLLKSILRAGTFEMLYKKSVPARVVINEYVELTHSFYSKNESALVNGVLDRIAKDNRKEELEN